MPVSTLTDEVSIRSRHFQAGEQFIDVNATGFHSVSIRSRHFQAGEQRQIRLSGFL